MVQLQGGRDALCFVVNGNKKTVWLLSSPFCVDGYYKLTGINDLWLERYFTGQRHDFKMDHGWKMFQVLEVVLTLLIRHLKRLKVEHV